MIENSLKIFKCLSDKSRLRIVSNLLIEPMYVELLSKRLDLAASTVSFHLKKLEAAGIVSSRKDQYYVIYKIENDLLESTLRSLIKGDADQDSEEEIRQSEYREKIIKTFFEYDKLRSIPVQRKKRLLVLEEIIKVFILGATYNEKEVNEKIKNFHNDFCTIRRELISEKLFERSDGIYRRIK